MQKHKKLMILAGIGGAMVIAGFCVGQFWGNPILQEAKQTERWIQTPGVITRAKVARITNPGGSDEFVADIRYYYYVKGRKYEGTDIHFGGNPHKSQGGLVFWVISRYHVDGKVPVYYDPAKPERAVLEPGATFSSSRVWFAGWAVASVGVFLMVLALCRWVVRMSQAAMERAY